MKCCRCIKSHSYSVMAQQILLRCQTTIEPVYTETFNVVPDPELHLTVGNYHED